MYEMQVLTDDVWESVCLAPVSVGKIRSPYRYERKDDAELMLKKLYPDEPSEHLRVIPV